MLAYFARRFISGAVSLLALTFLLYYICFGLPAIEPDIVREIHYFKTPPSSGYIQRLVQLYHLDEPFMTGYLLWLFDARPIDEDALQPSPSMDINIAGYRISGSGLLTGDFGQSLQVARAFRLWIYLSTICWVSSRGSFCRGLRLHVYSA